MRMPLVTFLKEYTEALEQINEERERIKQRQELARRSAHRGRR